MTLFDANSPSLLVKSEVARAQMDLESKKAPVTGPLPSTDTSGKKPSTPGMKDLPKAPTQPNVFMAQSRSIALGVGRDAARIAEEIIGHLTLSPRVNCNHHTGNRHRSPQWHPRRPCPRRY